MDADAAAMETKSNTSIWFNSQQAWLFHRHSATIDSGRVLFQDDVDITSDKLRKLTIRHSDSFTDDAVQLMLNPNITTVSISSTAVMGQTLISSRITKLELRINMLLDPNIMARFSQLQHLDIHTGAVMTKIPCELPASLITLTTMNRGVCPLYIDCSAMTKLKSLTVRGSTMFAEGSKLPDSLEKIDDTSDSGCTFRMIGNLRNLEYYRIARPGKKHPHGVYSVKKVMSEVPSRWCTYLTLSPGCLTKTVATFRRVENLTIMNGGWEWMHLPKHWLRSLRSITVMSGGVKLVGVPVRLEKFVAYDYHQQYQTIINTNVGTLKKLTIMDNTPMFDYFGMTRLQKLTVKFNTNDSRIAVIGTLTGLKLLSIVVNEDGVDGIHLSRLTGLRELNITAKWLTNWDRMLNNMKSLETLHVMCAVLPMQVPDCIGFMPHLRDLSIVATGPPLKMSCPQSLCRLTHQLKTFNISENVLHSPFSRDLLPLLATSLKIDVSQFGYTRKEAIDAVYGGVCVTDLSDAHGIATHNMCTCPDHVAQRFSGSLFATVPRDILTLVRPMLTEWYIVHPHVRECHMRVTGGLQIVEYHKQDDPCTYCELMHKTIDDARRFSVKVMNNTIYGFTGTTAHLDRRDATDTVARLDRPGIAEETIEILRRRLSEMSLGDLYGLAPARIPSSSSSATSTFSAADRPLHNHRLQACGYNSSYQYIMHSPEIRPPIGYAAICASPDTRETQYDVPDDDDVPDVVPEG